MISLFLSSLWDFFLFQFHAKTSLWAYQFCVSENECFIILSRYITKLLSLILEPWRAIQKVPHIEKAIVPNGLNTNVSVYGQASVCNNVMR